jgi:TLC domain
MRKEWTDRPLGSALRHPKDLQIFGAGLLLYAALYTTSKLVLSRLLIRLFAKRKLKESTEKKFSRALWKFLVYSTLALYGIASLCTEAWMLSPIQITFAWPGNNTPSKINLYYLLETIYYTGSFATMFLEEKQSDFYLMLWHHFVTLVLIGFSYRCNFLRHGVFLMILHDVSDPWMESAKLTVYLGYQRLGNVLFGIFTAAFIIPRIVVYPLFILVPGWGYMNEYRDVRLVPIYCLLMAVFLLNCYWAVLILRMLVEFIKRGNVERDIRDQEEEKKEK